MDNDPENSSAAKAIHLASLIHKVKENQLLTDLEQQELEDWKGRHEEAFATLMDREKFIAELKVMDHYDTRRAVNVIFSRLGLRTPARVRQLRVLSRRLSVAAIFILLIGGAWLFLVKPTKTRIDLPPGGNKATLTLADGSTIVLDTAASGALADQGGVEVVKKENGKITYQPLNNNIPVAYNKVTTPRGGQYAVELPDGSKVWLNAASSIRFPTRFMGKERVVEVTGEADIQVVRNEQMPFKVVAGDEKWEVLGTEFDINAYNDEPAIRTTLVEGAVRTHEKILKPGQQSSVSRTTGEIDILDDVNTADVTAWKNGLFVFKEGTDLYTVMREIGRWYDVDIEYAGKIPEVQLGGKIPRNTNAAGLLQILTYSSNLQFKIEGRKITVLP